MEKNETCLFDLVERIRITWEVTHKCNYSCQHCSANAKERLRDELSTERALRLIDEMNSLGVGAIYFTGGEPLTRNDIFDIIGYASTKENIIRMNLATNGSLVTDDVAERIANLRLDAVLVSLDGYTPQTHNRFRGVNSAFDNTLQAIVRLTKEGVNVKIGTVIWKDNVDYLEDIVKIGVEKGAYEVFFNWLVKSGRSVKNPNIFVDCSKYMEVVRKIDELEQKYAGMIKIGYHRFKLIHDGFPSCMGGKRLYHITANGHIGPCSWIVKLDPSMLSKKSLLDYPLQELIEDIAIKKFKDKVHERAGIYGPGCLAMCLAENKTYLSYDPLYAERGNFVK